jgi:hypothetical protein
MSFDPLMKIERAREVGKLPDRLYKLIADRFHIVTNGIDRIERSSGLQYPYYYIDPNLILSTSNAEFEQFGIFFARTIPLVSKNKKLAVVIQLTAPLIAYGLLGSIHAILGHEFMHYVSFIRRILQMNVISDEIAGTLFEGKYKDFDSLIDPRDIFKKDPVLVDHITRRFPEGFKDLKLEQKVIKNWINKHLPLTIIPIDSNIVKIPIEVIVNTEVDKILKEKIEQL